MPHTLPPRAFPFGEFRHDGKVGVIDIGSNSVRLVVYDGIKRVPVPVYNEKSMCGLGKGLGKTGYLNPDGVKEAERCLTRLLAMARMLDVVELQVLATAAVRDAKDGAAFVKRLEKEHQIRIHVISGQREAQLAGLGVQANMHSPRGVVADLGGGSMELVHVKGLQVQHPVTLPLGSLRLVDMESHEAVRALVRKHLGKLDWLGANPQEAFYAVGGSFRAIAKLHIEQTDYPLTIVHHYRVPMAAMVIFCRHIQTLTVAELKELDVPGKRAPALPVVAIVLEEMLLATHAEEVVFCTSGIREGYLYEHLAPFIRMEDPLFASVTDVSRHERLLQNYPEELFAWMEPVFAGESEGERRVRQAACILSELAWHIHPEYRANYAFQRTLQSAIVGLDHAQRVALALAMYRRYRYKEPVEQEALSLLSVRQMAHAQAVGVAAHLAFQLSGAHTGNLPLSELRLVKKELQLHMAEQIEDVMDDGVRKRLAYLGEHLAQFRS
jgi:exopolyphosphatase/guanosine-5'-triphosphate,3'-diphosphate pyrophosphatase